MQSSDTKVIVERALENISRPERITDRQWEFYKAGVRAVVTEINKILRERSKQRVN